MPDQHHKYICLKYIFMPFTAFSPTSCRFANVLSLFAKGSLGQFPNFFRLISGLKNGVYIRVWDLIVSRLKEYNEIYALYSARFVSLAKVNELLNRHVSETVGHHLTNPEAKVSSEDILFMVNKLHIFRLSKDIICKDTKAGNIIS